jgi:hypothetical protein
MVLRTVVFWWTITYLSPLTAATLTVDRNGAGQYTGIQAAVDAASDGDTVVVAPGEYVITEPIDGNRLHDPTDPASPPLKNVVLRSEGGPEVTVIRRAEAGRTRTEEASVVVFENGETADSVLDGFTIVGGKEGFCEAVQRWCGGGLKCANGSSPTVRKCRITDSTPAVYCWDSSPSLSACTVTHGRVLCGKNASPELLECTITEGYGVDCVENASPVFTRCSIVRNRAAVCGSGGGVKCSGDSAPTLIDCLIAGNVATWGSLGSEEPCGGAGGGVACRDRAAPTLINCVVSGNRAESATYPAMGAGVIVDGGEGGGVSCAGNSIPHFINCTITDNMATCGGGMYASYRSFPRFTNCIVWNNEGGSIDSDIDSHPLASFSCIEGEHVWLGQGNTNADPLFVRPGAYDFERFVTVSMGDWEVRFPDFVIAAGDYRLQEGSPCIDAGRLEGAPATDKDGDGRPCGAGVDMGAYERGGCPAGRYFIRGDANSDGNFNVADPIYTLLYTFAGAEAPACLDAADSNDDGGIDVADAIYVLQYLFAEGSMIPSPYPGCGIDRTIDSLDCSSYEPCRDG